jgi:hypothetical protein
MERTLADAWPRTPASEASSFSDQGVEFVINPACGYPKAYHSAVSLNSKFVHWYIKSFLTARTRSLSRGTKEHFYLKNILWKLILATHYIRRVIITVKREVHAIID